MISVSHATLHKRDLSIPRCISGQPQLSPWHYVTPQWHSQDLMVVAGGINEPIPPHVTTLQKNKNRQQYKIHNCWLFIILTMMMIEDWIVSCACELIVVTVFLSTSLRGDGNMRKLVYWLPSWSVSLLDIWRDYTRYLDTDQRLIWLSFKVKVFHYCQSALQPCIHSWVACLE